MKPFDKKRTCYVCEYLKKWSDTELDIYPPASFRNGKMLSVDELGEYDLYVCIKPEDKEYISIISVMIPNEKWGITNANTCNNYRKAFFKLKKGD